MQPVKVDFLPISGIMARQVLSAGAWCITSSGLWASPLVSHPGGVDSHLMPGILERKTPGRALGGGVYWTQSG